MAKTSDRMSHQVQWRIICGGTSCRINFRNKKSKKMDYISKKIGSKVQICVFNENFRDAAVHEQSHLEFCLMLLLGYLWNRNIEHLQSESQLYCYTEIQHPSIGKIVDLCRTLDVDGEFFKGRKLKDFKESVNAYPALRNEKMGHGYSFDDDAKALFEKISELKDLIYQGPEDFFGSDFDFVKVGKREENTYRGIMFKANGDVTPWVLPCDAGDMVPGRLYLRCESNFAEISPLIAVDDDDEFHTFAFVEDQLAARSVFNRLVKTGRGYFATPTLVDFGSEIDEHRKRSSNGTIVNIYENNYRKYIDTDIVRKIVKFLKSNESTVFATLWGHGGVGKTASIQRVCESLLSAERRSFDYIIFVSAKDRQINIYTGAIEAIEGGVDSFDQVIAFANRIVFQTDSHDPTPLVAFNGRILLVLDDYETFPAQEKEKLVNFVKTLNIAHHKVVITTRSANHITGEEIEVLELSKDETISFFDSVLESDLRIDPDIYKRNIDLKKFEVALHELTSGRPLFIFQSAMIYGQSSSISELLSVDLRGRRESIEFLYGRIWDYLSADARRVFWAMGQLVSESDLSNVLSKLRYILSMEKDEQKFNSAIGELVKLKVVKLADGKFFKVYSSEIATIMRESRIDEGDAGGIKGRLLTVGSDKKLDSNLALLNDADSSRVSHKATEVINKYRHLISRAATPRGIKAKAVVNLAQYLIEDAGDYDHGIKVFEEFNLEYNKSAEFVRVFATYLWRGDETLKERAIASVKDALNVDEPLAYEEELDLLSMLMHYESTLLIGARQELKDSLRLGESDETEYARRFAEQRHDFFRIYNYPGLKIFDVVKNERLKDFSHELKLKCLNGLSHFMDVCLRRKKFEDINDIYLYVFNELKYNYHDAFKQKLDRVLRSGVKQVRTYEEYVEPGSRGDRFAGGGTGVDTGAEKTAVGRDGTKRRQSSTTRSVPGSFAQKLLGALEEVKDS
ncbi:NB-ARC domain-containing protein [Paraburkholderia sediminicola]|uniref:NB-ARC domain-containing protein n=1 Tax=Paraburkholderia sediminicola TaxID=458836 RepID=UPI0038BDA2E8